MEAREILLEQKLADNALRIANTEYLITLHKAKGNLWEAKKSRVLVEKLKKDRDILLSSRVKIEVIEDDPH